ncbi:MAG TPA: glycosyltransferase family 4 protein [Candidatus Magasanikbacteria bacterium]|nr:glycosyltransferase family 4 protein [Candidatus Magasanikbacteria bacterium]
MKILYLITKSEAGGAQTHVVDLCNYFKNKENEIVVMSSGNGWLKTECDKMGVRFVENRYFSNKPCPRRLFNAIKEIRKFAGEFKPDIVHCHSSSAGILGRLAIKGKIRTIYTAHGWGFNIGMKPWIKYPVLWLEKLCARYTDTYICVAEFVKQLGLKYNLAPEKKFKVIYNGVSLADINQSKIIRRGGLKSKIGIIFVGRLAEPKKPELTIEAISLLPEEIKNNIKFTIIGDGPKRYLLEKIANDKKIKVEFKGALEKSEALKELEKADIFVFISSWEGFPYTILEAMSYGLPVITSDVGGTSEAVNEQNGILVKNEVGQIRDAILKLVSDRELRLIMGEQGRRDIATKFSLEQMVNEIEKVYNQF